ncbi:endospore germination permease [Paenibacillus sp. GCM10023248]|uniref:GerAB/ArcD/ProY family transporter n=1 Tax=Bacillales TaxID=1385 RepID=UPI0023787CCD|nr:MULTISPECIES: endospore germination permease [Bacillales]MDD9268960.1 endospore germination permease [Paenibacillus sp. MAHUQ-63]MDR6881960.1 spore germination protein KB [Bacillus sp. 3255]
MNNENSLTARQLMILVFLVAVGTTVLVVPSLLAMESKQDAWIAGIAGVAIGLLFIRMYVRLAKMFPAQSLFDMNETVFGKWLGKAFTLLYVFIAAVISAQVLFYIGAFMTTQIMPTTPIQSIHILMITFVIIGAKLGVIILARTAEIFFPWMVLLLILLFICVTPQADVINLLPIGEASLMSIARSSYYIVVFSYFPIAFVLCLITNQVKLPVRFSKAFTYGGITSGVVLVLITLFSIIVMGPDQSSRQIYATYALAKKISVGNFLQRIEVTVAFLWFISIYFKLTLYFNAVLQGIASLFRLQNYKAFATPTGLIITVLSLLVYPNVAYSHHWDEFTWIPLATCIGFIHPALLIGVGYLRKKMTNNS